MKILYFVFIAKFIFISNILLMYEYDIDGITPSIIVGASCCGVIYTLMVSLYNIFIQSNFLLVHSGQYRAGGRRERIRDSLQG